MIVHFNNTLKQLLIEGKTMKQEKYQYDTVSQS